MVPECVNLKLTFELQQQINVNIIKKNSSAQGTNARKVNCGCVYSAYILKPVLSGRNL